jgi:hypothetical protein
MRYLLGVVFCGGLGVIGVASADVPMPAEIGWSLETLMTNLHRIQSASAHFVETKTVHMLTRPLTVAGTLNYVAPDKLEKITTTPAPESIRLDGETLTGTRSNGEHYSVDIGAHTEIAALVEGIRSTLAGDLPTLQRYYTIAFSGGRASWQLDLVPKDRRVREKVNHIRIAGAEAAIHNIEVDEKDGDRSEMTITPDGS